MTILNILIPIALAAVLIVLALGLHNLMRGGRPIMKTHEGDESVVLSKLKVPRAKAGRKLEAGQPPRTLDRSDSSTCDSR